MSRETNRDPEAWARLGSALRAARETRQWTQEELAQKAKVSSRAVQEAERGRPPRGRMPYTLTPIARELGWPAGSVDAVLSGQPAPGGWVDAPVELDEEMVEMAITSALVRSTRSVTTGEIRQAVALAVAEFRRAGVLRETDGTTSPGR